MSADLTQAEFRARMNRVNANRAAVNGKHAMVRRQPWRLLRNRRLLNECVALLAESDRILASLALSLPEPKP